jgi:hypothetical protein
MDKPYQRKGSTSNTHVGIEFENKAQGFFKKQKLLLQKNISIEIGINGKKTHNFDLGDTDAKVIVECKSHTWTEGGNVPSAKITSWNQAMYYFYATPKEYRKIFFVLKDYSLKRKETLADYFIRTNSHLIPKDVEFWEFDDKTNHALRIK